MISALHWIPKGAARAKPARFELSPEELQRIKALAEYSNDLLCVVINDCAEKKRVLSKKVALQKNRKMWTFLTSHLS